MNSYTRIQKTAAITVFNSGGQENANDRIGVGNGNGQGRNNGQGTGNALETVAEIITTTEKYVYDGANVIADYDGSNNLLTTYLTPFLDQNLTMTKGGNTYYYTQDGLGSVREVLGANQVVKNSYDYYAFGEALNWSETIENRYTYTAREWDNESQTNYFRARNQDPRTGRFLSADPIGYLGGINLYSYVGSNPVVHADPMGLSGDLFDWSKIFDPVVNSPFNRDRKFAPKQKLGTPSLTTDCQLAEALFTHWLSGEGKKFTRGGSVLRHNAGVKTKTKFELWSYALKICKRLNNDNVANEMGLDSMRITGSDIQATGTYLTHSLNTPNPHYLISIIYSAELGVESNDYETKPCTVEFDNTYTWFDRTDIHPGAYLFPDLFPLSILKGLGLTTDYDVEISWSAKTTFKTCPTKGKGWPWD